MIEKTLDKILEQLVLLNSKVTASGATAPEPAAKVETKSEPVAAPAPPPAPPVEQTAAAVTRESVGAALRTVAVVSMEAAVQLLAKYGAKLVADLKPEQYVAVMADATAFHAKLAGPAESFGL